MASQENKSVPEKVGKGLLDYGKWIYENMNKNNINETSQKTTNQIFGIQETPLETYKNLWLYQDEAKVHSI